MTEKENRDFSVEERREAESINNIEYDQEIVDISGDIRSLAIVSAVSLVASILNMIPVLNFFGAIAEVFCVIWLLVALFHLGKVVSQYKKAAILKIVGAVIIVVGSAVDAIGISVGWVVELAGLLVMFMAEHNEYEGHRELLIGVDDGLSKKWKKLWGWYAASLATAIVGEAVIVLVPEIAFDMIAVLAITAGIIIFSSVIGIMKLVYLMKMYKAFD